MTDPGVAFSALLWLGELLTLVYIGYRCGLALLALRRRQPDPVGTGQTVFLIMVAARNEENVIAATIRNLNALSYPEANRSVIVVADDCTDDTVLQAQAAGARVLVKPGPAKGKGHVIQWALAQPEMRDAGWEALVLLDADSLPRPDFLLYMDAAVQGGAVAMQGRSESVPQAGWVANGYAVNNSQRNRTWHLAREMAGFSAALTGTGVCLTRGLLETLPPVIKTLTEDLEYSAQLTRAGVRVRYLHEALIRIEQPHSLKSSVQQRLRWARGQIVTTALHSPGLLLRGVRHADLSAFDMALYLALPSLTPFQAGMFVWAAGELLIPGVWPNAQIDGLPAIPPWLLLAGVSLTIVVAFAGLTAEHRRVKVRDLAAFSLVMASWLPIAVYAAMTTWVRSWNRTPHGVAAPDEAEAEERTPPVPTGTLS